MSPARDPVYRSLVAVPLAALQAVVPCTHTATAGCIPRSRRHIVVRPDTGLQLAVGAAASTVFPLGAAPEELPVR